PPVRGRRRANLGRTTWFHYGPRSEHKDLPVDNFRRSFAISASIACMATSTRASNKLRPLWFDARFLIGIVLVVASAAGVWWVVHAARTTQPVLAAAHAIVPGQAVTAAD